MCLTVELFFLNSMQLHYVDEYADMLAVWECMTKRESEMFWSNYE